MAQTPPPPPPQRPARKRPYKPRRKGVHRRKHHLSAKGLASSLARRKTLAAWRKANGIKLHRKFHHRKPMTAAQHQHFILAVRAASLRRRLAGIRVHRHLLSAAARARLIARLRMSPHRGARNVSFYRVKAVRTHRQPTRVSNRIQSMSFRIKGVRMVSSNPARRRRKRHI